MGNIVLMAMLLGDTIEGENGYGEIPITLITLNEKHFDLFEIENGFIKSSGVTKRLQIRDSKSTKGQSSANKRWADGNQETRKKAQKCIFYVLKIYKKFFNYIFLY